MNLKKPLVRFKIEYHDYELLNLYKFENKYSQIVANPSEVFKFWKRNNPKSLQN